MIKELYTFEKEMPTVTMIRQSASRYQEESGSEVRFKHITEVTCEDIDWCDVLHCIRPNDPYSVHLARCARESGSYVTCYYDDDVYDYPASLPNPFWRRNSVRNVLGQAHAVHSCSPYICQKYLPYTSGKISLVSDTAVESDEIKRIASLDEADLPEGKVKLIYAANPGHVGFFNRFIMPVMPQLCERYGERISMTFIGVRPDLSAYASQMEIHYIPGMPLEEYRKKIREGNYDIGLSPLTTDEFTKCKYFNKFIEYTMAGVVGIYSRTEPYTYVVQDGVNGLLSGDAPEDWFACLCRAIDDAMLRNCCVRAAQELLLTEFSPRRQQEKMAEYRKRYQKRNGRPCGTLAMHQLVYRLVRVLDKAYLLFFYLRQGGVSAVLEKLRG